MRAFEDSVVPPCRLCPQCHPLQSHRHPVKGLERIPGPLDKGHYGHVMVETKRLVGLRAGKQSACSEAHIGGSFGHT